MEPVAHVMATGSRSRRTALLALLVAAATAAGCASTPSLGDTWRAYAAGDPGHVAARFDAFFRNALPPGSELARSVEVIAEHHFGDAAKLDIRIGRFETWLAASRSKETNRWQFTLDERPVLERLTPDWTVTHVGRFDYRSPTSLTPEQRRAAQALERSAHRLDETFGYAVRPIDYYLAPPGPDAARVIGETNPGAGKARVGTIKAVGRANHEHELVHVYALRIGLAGPFLDEGLAVALSHSHPIATDEQCDQVLDLAKAGIAPQLAPGHFTRSHTVDHRPVYPYAGAVVSHWIDTFGVPPILATLRDASSVSPPVTPCL